MKSNKELYQVPDRELLLFFKIGERPHNWEGYLVKSYDHGKTWTEKEPLPDGSISPVKNKPVLLDNGILLCPSSDESDGWKVHFEATPDFGKTWTLLQVSKLPNNNAGADTIALADGRQLLVYNNVKTPINAKRGYRTPLNVAISDNGVNWYAALVLEESEIKKYSYPAVIQSTDGMIYITYT